VETQGGFNTKVGSLTARRRSQPPSVVAGETLMSPMCCLDGPLMGRAKLHIGGGPRAQVQYKYMDSSNTPLVVLTLAMTNVETGVTLGKEWSRRPLVKMT
jgi:hypothetical protein